MNWVLTNIAGSQFLLRLLFFSTTSVAFSFLGKYWVKDEGGIKDVS